MKKSKTSLGLKDLSPAEKVEYSKGIVQSMTGNANFTNPIPALSTVLTAANDLDTAITNAIDGGKSLVAIRRQKEEALDDCLTQLAHYVDSIAKGDPAIILSAGIPVKNGNTQPLPLNAPEHISASSNSTEGEIELEWDSVKRSRAFVVEQCEDIIVLPEGRVRNPGNAGWKIIAVLTKRKLKVMNLVSGIKYAFRVYCVGAAGKSECSNVVVAKAL